MKSEVLDAAKAHELNEQGVAAFEAEKYEDALTLFLSAEQYNASCAIIKMNIGSAYNAVGFKELAAENMQDASTYLLKALEYDTTNELYKKNIAYVYNLLGVKAFDAGSLEEALAYQLKAVEFDATNELYKKNVATVYDVLVHFSCSDNEKCDLQLKAVEFYGCEEKYHIRAFSYLILTMKEGFSAFIPRIADLIEKGDSFGYMNMIAIKAIASKKFDTTMLLNAIMVQEKLVLNITGPYCDIVLQKSHIMIIDSILKGRTSISYLSFSDNVKFSPEVKDFLNANVHLWKSVEGIKTENHAFRSWNIQHKECGHLLHAPSYVEYTKDDSNMFSLVKDVSENKWLEILVKYDVETLHRSCFKHDVCMVREGRAAVAAYMKRLVLGAATCQLAILSEYSPKCGVWLPNEIIAQLFSLFTTKDLCVMAKSFVCREKSTIDSIKSFFNGLT